MCLSALYLVLKKGDEVDPDFGKWKSPALVLVHILILLGALSSNSHLFVDLLISLLTRRGVLRTCTVTAHF